MSLSQVGVPQVDLGLSQSKDALSLLSSFQGLSLARYWRGACGERSRCGPATWACP